MSTVVERKVIILAFRNEVVADVYGLALESVLDAQVITCHDSTEAGKALREHPEACVIIEAGVPGGSLTPFFERQAALAKRAHVYVLGGDPASLPPNLDPTQVEFLPANPEMRLV